MPTHSPGHTEGTQGTPRTCDLFCTVIDNFGDAGVCWRLACQLSHERGWTVRLFIDLPEALAPLRGGASTAMDAIRIAPWPKDDAPWRSNGDVGSMGDVGDVGDVVIEAFGCTLPDGFLAAMAERETPPVWINLEYLSAEAWVRGCHLGRSPHPRLALSKTFFFPGMVNGTGGLSREQDLDQDKRLFLADVHAQQGLWSRLGMTPPPPEALIITLFAYENPAIESLLNQWSDPALTALDGAERITLIVPMGRISPQVARWLGESTFTAGMAVQRGRLTVHAVPFVSQGDYDRLLWLADMNFVRGEDSFVRAQWAEQPFVWQIYPQADDAHLEKLDAALTLYLASLPDATRDAIRHFWHAWNAAMPTEVCFETNALPAPDWIAFWAHRATMQKHAAPWAAALQCPGSLSANLADFVESQLK